MNRLLAFSVSCTLLVGGVSIADAAGPTFKAVKNGTARGEVINGTRVADRIDGKAGNDTLIGGAGNDRITGGRGRDIISGGLGNDVVYAKDREVDQILCGPGRDTVYRDKGDKVSGDCEVKR